MTRRLVLGCLLLVLAGWFAPVPVQAMSSTRAAALWRTEAFARAAVAQAEAGDMAAAEESLALAVEASQGISDQEERARARGLVAWTRARLGDAEGAFAEALGIERVSDRLMTLLRLAAAYEARGDEAQLRRALDPVREMMTEQLAHGKPPKEDLVLIYFGWFEGRIGNAQSVMALAERLERDRDRAALVVFTAGGQLVAGDRDGARGTIETLLGNLDPESRVWGDGDLLGVAAYVQSLAGDAAGVYGWAAALANIEDRALVFALTAAGRAAAGDVDGTFEAARRARIEVTLGPSRTKTGGLFFGAETLATSAEAVALARAGDLAGALRRVRAIENDLSRFLASLILAGALDVAGDRTGAKAAAEIALAARASEPDDRSDGEVEWFGQPTVAHVLAGDLGAALVTVADSNDQSPVDAGVAWFRVLGRALAGNLIGLPEAGFEFYTRLGIFENRPGPSIARAELQAMTGDAAGARITAKGITDDYDRDSVLQRIALVQAAAGDIDDARLTAASIPHVARRDAARAEVDAIASGTLAPREAEATAVSTLAQALAIADPYGRSRALGAVARTQIAAGKRDAARETIALARAAAEAETAPLYRALSLVRVAEALVAADDLKAALDIVPLAHAAAGAIEVPPKEG